MFNTRKGITPVIAIVLLLLITVGAVGVVYTQFQSLVGNPDEQLSQQQQVRNTEMTFSSVYSDSSELAITVRNTGSVTWNTSQFALGFVPQGSSSPVIESVLESSVSSFSHANSNECFSADTGTQIVEPDGTYTCTTGISFPGATKQIGLVVSMNGADKDWSYTCSVQTSNSISC